MPVTVRSPTALILAGGAGTRLKPLVADRPKPLAETAGRPFIEYILHQLRRAAIVDVVICSGYMGDVIARELGDGSRWGVDIAYSAEPTPLGTAGALKLAEPLLAGDRWLLMNGDSFFDISLADLMAAHDRHRPAMTLALARVADGQRYGSVTIDRAGVLQSFASAASQAGPALINGGVYVVERSVLDLIPADRPASLERDVIPMLLERDARGMVFDGYFIDIGVPDDYLRAQRETERFEQFMTQD